MREEWQETIKKGDYVLVEDDNVFVEAKWKDKEIIAYSKDGYAHKKWVMPQSWEGTKSVDLYEISINGPELIESGKKIENGRLILSLHSNEGISILPHNHEIN